MVSNAAAKSKRRKRTPRLMFAIIGVLAVIGAIIGGYLMEHGHLLVLYQPAELVIIGGAAVGSMLIGNPPSVLKKILGGAMGVIKGSRYSKEFFLTTLKMLNDLFLHARKNGTDKLEQDVEAPQKSQVFSKYPNS